VAENHLISSHVILVDDNNDDDDNAKSTYLETQTRQLHKIARRRCKWSDPSPSRQRQRYGPSRDP
jgi:hypothetical protein